MRIHAQQVLTPEGLMADQTVVVENGVIASILPGDQQADTHCACLTPGLIDLHIHGGAGFSARNFGMKNIETFLSQMTDAGVTGFLMTISTARRELMRSGLETTREAMKLQQEGKLSGPIILGVHLEGPFLSTGKAGAMQSSAIVSGSKEAYEDFFAGYEDIIRLVTLAPEEPGAEELIRHLTKKGVCVQSGHTTATYEEACRGFEAGITSMCHTFNGCRGIHHREPGVVTAALENDNIYTEAICDLVHLHPAILRMMYRLKGPHRMAMISDSVHTHGLPDGEYFAEGYHIVVKDGVSRLPDGTLDGGGAYLDQAVRNLVSIGIPAADVLTMASMTPASRIGLEHAIAPGKSAHLTLWDEQLRPVTTITEGRLQWKS